MRNLLNLGVCLFVLFAFLGCEKDADLTDEVVTEAPQTSWQSANDAVVVESILNEVVYITVTQSMLQTELFALAPPSQLEVRDCPNDLVEDVNLENPFDSDDPLIKKYTCDFQDGCDLNGSIVKGKLIAYFSGGLAEAGTEILVEVEDFVLNGCIVDIKNNGYMYGSYVADVDEIIRYNVETINTCITQEGTTTPINLLGSWNDVYLDENGTLFDDLGPAALLDDSLAISIELAHGYNVDGDYFRASTQITDQNGDVVDFPLTYSLVGCRWIQDGVLNIDTDGQLLQLINYGYGGGCDGLVEIVQGDESVIIDCP